MSPALPNQKKLISISGAAKVLGVSIDTVRRWDNSGILHSERANGKNRYFSLSELEAHKSNQPLSISEVSKKLKISPTTLRRLEDRGLLVPQRNNAGERVYDKDSIKNFQNSEYLLRRKQIKEKTPEPLKEEKIFTEAEMPKKADPHQKSVDGSPLSNSIKDNPNLKPWQRIPEFMGSLVIFVLLVGIGIMNVNISTVKSSQTLLKPVTYSAPVTHVEPVAMVEVPEASKAAEASPSAEPAAKPVTYESVQALIKGTADFDPKEATKGAEKRNRTPDLTGFKILLDVDTHGAGYINIREKPSTDSAKISEAKDGDSFEMVSRDSGWFEIRLNGQLDGFMLQEFAKIKEIK